MPAEFKTIGIPERQRPLAFKPSNAATRREDPQAHKTDGRAAAAGIRHNEAVPPVAIPPGHVGPVVLPGSGRLVYWTGRVAIGLRHQRAAHAEPVSQSALWVQDLMLGTRNSVAA
jgi:hypothetical protein